MKKTRTICEATIAKYVNKEYTVFFVVFGEKTDPGRVTNRTGINPVCREYEVLKIFKKSKYHKMSRLCHFKQKYEE